TAVKIEPNYQHPTIYVTDASRSVGVVSALLSEDLKAEFVEKTRADYELVRERHKGRQAKNPQHNLEKARQNRFSYAEYQPIKPKFLGTQVIDNLSLATLVDYIDWTPFFQTWELSGRYPAILTDHVVGIEATKLFAD